MITPKATVFGALQKFQASPLGRTPEQRVAAWNPLIEHENQFHQMVQMVMGAPTRGLKERGPFFTYSSKGKIHADTRAQSRTQLHGYIKQLMDKGLNHSDATKYLYYQLYKMRETKKKEPLESTVPGAYAKTIPGQLQDITTKGRTYDQPHFLARYIGEQVIPQQAEKKFALESQLADAYAVWLARPKRSKMPNPLTVYGVGRMGLPKEVPLTPETLKQEALLHYQEELQSLGGDIQPGTYMDKLTKWFRSQGRQGTYAQKLTGQSSASTEDLLGKIISDLQRGINPFVAKPPGTSSGGGLSQNIVSQFLGK